MYATDKQNTFGIFRRFAVPCRCKIARYKRIALCRKFFGSNEIPWMAGIRRNAVQAIDQIGAPDIDSTLLSTSGSGSQEQRRKQ